MKVYAVFAKRTCILIAYKTEIPFNDVGLVELNYRREEIIPSKSYSSHISLRNGRELFEVSWGKNLQETFAQNQKIIRKIVLKQPHRITFFVIAYYSSTSPPLSSSHDLRRSYLGCLSSSSIARYLYTAANTEG